MCLHLSVLGTVHFARIHSQLYVVQKRGHSDPSRYRRSIRGITRIDRMRNKEPGQKRESEPESEVFIDPIKYT